MPVWSASWRMFGSRKPDGPPTFQEVVTAAVNDVLAHGYDSEIRIDDWIEQIRAAAEREMVSEDELGNQLRSVLFSLYRREVERRTVLRRHPGASAYTLARVAPELRLELDRRIVASADLIKLNREEAIASTLRRFRGWATSIPAGGAPLKDRIAIKGRMRAALTSLPFEERRVIIDQSHKLTASINAVVAEGGGAIAAMWRSNWRQANYDYRPEHRQIDGEIFLIRDSWADKAGLVRRGEGRYTDEIERPAQLPFCRCYYRYLYSLDNIPESMLTTRGREALRAAA